MSLVDELQSIWRRETMELLLLIALSTTSRLGFKKVFLSGGVVVDDLINQVSFQLLVPPKNHRGVINLSAWTKPCMI
jgi:hypothetical protein